MDYKTQYTILKRLLMHYAEANGNSVLQDILNDQDFSKLNEVFFQIYARIIDKNNTLTNIYDLYNLQIFDIGIDNTIDVYSIGKNDWLRTLTLVDLFEKSIFQENAETESTFKLLNNVVLVKGETSIIQDYEQISQKQRPLSHVDLGNINPTELLERYELLHEFIFLSFTLSCYKNFLILDDSNYNEFENLLELNVLKLISCLDSEMKFLSDLEELKKKYNDLKQQYNVQETINNDILQNQHDGMNVNNNMNELIQTRDKLEDKLSEILEKTEVFEKQNSDLESRFTILKANFKKILLSLPELPETEDSETTQIQHKLQQLKLVDLEKANVSNIKTTLLEIWSFLSKQNDINLEETDKNIKDLNERIEQQRKTIQSFKKSESEFAEKKNELELMKKSGLLQNEALKNSILQEYVLIKTLEEDYITKISDLYAKINKVDLKKYVSKFIELEETITMMDSEILEKEI
ncbi:hypothetical protein D499_0T00580 [Hanseniaspora uvarum DSM 2768]|nr:hypothetical protein D499_0T00580 [Hanseniaspora uvarum DSM 2768]